MTALLSVALPVGAGSPAPQGGPSAARPPATVIRLRTAPPLEPPFDDELPASYPSQAEQLCFDEPSTDTAVDDRVEPAEGQVTCRHGRPDPRRWARQFLVVAMEILAGRRPLSQISQWATVPAAAGIRAAQRAAGPRPCQGRRVPVPPYALHSVHVNVPADGVAEVCAVIRRGARFWALAARLEGLDGRWRCVTFRML